MIFVYCARDYCRVTTYVKVFFNWIYLIFAFWARRMTLVWDLMFAFSSNIKEKLRNTVYTWLLLHWLCPTLFWHFASFACLAIYTLNIHCRDGFPMSHCVKFESTGCSLPVKHFVYFGVCGILQFLGLFGGPGVVQQFRTPISFSSSVFLGGGAVYP